jgi:hypothetical protein
VPLLDAAGIRHIIAINTGSRDLFPIAALLRLNLPAVP